MTHKFSISFPDDLASRLRAMAQARGIFVSQLLQEFASDMLGADGCKGTESAVKPAALTRVIPTMVDKSLDSETRQAVLLKAIESRRFTPPMQQALRLVLLDGLSQAKAAKQCGIAHRQAINNALRSLRVRSGISD